ncbi:MAG: BrnT family toxin [Candidatus Omnitrophota bacterium]
MGSIKWDPEKNKKLVAERGVSFEEIIVYIENFQVLAVIENPNKEYRDQLVFVIARHNYVYYVPFVKEGENIFLKTIIPSRKLTKKYLKS